MSLLTMSKSLAGGEIPAVSLSFAKNKIIEALGKIEDGYEWHFKTAYAGWLAPGQLANTGTFTVTPYSNVVVANVTATAALAILAISNPPLTTLQYRDPARAIYSICGLGTTGLLAYSTVTSPGSGQTPGVYTLNGTVPGGQPGSGAQIQVTVGSAGTVVLPPVVLSAGSGYTLDYPPTFTLAAGGTPATVSAQLFLSLTLDRPWMEPTSGSGQPYMIYQAYFVAPAENFEKFLEMRDTTNSRPLDFWSLSQADLAERDPQRTNYSDPRFVVPAGVDLRPGSSTYGWPWYELWPQQLSYVPYSFSYRWQGPQLVNPADTVPYPITEELVMHRARELIYLFKEAQKGDDVQRGSGANWLMLAQASRKEFDEVLEKIQAKAINLSNESVSHVNSRCGCGAGVDYGNRLGQVVLGGFPSR